jgi:hypothetical protein
MAVTNRSWLRPLAWLLVAVLTLVAWRVGGQLVAAVRRVDVCLTVAGPRFEATGVAPGAFVARVDACVAHPTATQAFLDAVTEIPPLLVVLVAGVLLLLVLTDARTGDPFTARTVRRLRALALGRADICPRRPSSQLSSPPTERRRTRSVPWCALLSVLVPRLWFLDLDSPCSQVGALTTQGGQLVGLRGGELDAMPNSSSPATAARSSR